MRITTNQQQRFPSAPPQNLLPPQTKKDTCRCVGRLSMSPVFHFFTNVTRHTSTALPLDETNDCARQPLMFQFFLVPSKNRPVGLWSCARRSEGKKKKTHVSWVFSSSAVNRTSCDSVLILSCICGVIFAKCENILTSAMPRPVRCLPCL